MNYNEIWKKQNYCLEYIFVKCDFIEPNDKCSFF